MKWLSDFTGQAGGEKNKRIVSPQRHREHRDISFFIVGDHSTICRSYGAGTTTMKNQSALRAVIIMNVNVPVLKDGIKRLVL